MVSGLGYGSYRLRTALTHSPRHYSGLQILRIYCPSYMCSFKSQDHHVTLKSENQIIKQGEERVHLISLEAFIWS